MRSRLFSFPNPVDEVSARLVAGGVVVQALAFLAVREGWMLVPLVYGFLARVLSGPRFSPLGLFVTRVVTPLIGGEHHFVPGPPKRFAQAVGLLFSGGALLSWSLGGQVVACALIVGLIVAASLESVFAICLGCMVFGRLISWGIIPRSVCEQCGDISGRLAALSAASQAANS
jgi:hypothetical protein